MLAQQLDSMGQFSTLDEMRGGYDESAVTTDLRSESGPESDTWDRLPAGRDHKLSANNNSTITSMLFKDGSVASRKYQWIQVYGFSVFSQQRASVAQTKPWDEGNAPHQSGTTVGHHRDTSDDITFINE